MAPTASPALRVLHAATGASQALSLLCNTIQELPRSSGVQEDLADILERCMSAGDCLKQTFDFDVHGVLV